MEQPHRRAGQMAEELDQWAAIRVDDHSTPIFSFTPLPEGYTRITWDLNDSAGRVTGFGFVYIIDKAHAQKLTHKNYPHDVRNAATQYLKRESP